MRIRFAVLAAALFALPAFAADPPQPGMWKVTVRSETNGAVTAERSDDRCLTADALKSIEKSFAPEQGANCKRLSYEWTGQRLSWRIACTVPIAMDNSGWYAFDNPQHYTGEIVVKMIIPGGVDMLSHTRLEGQRIGDCPH
ncbi:MAG TPA: DUF3617 family protein [Pseudolabrys sp.]|nr:DUF3617 family protein [Pseudolabrys sp.]